MTVEFPELALLVHPDWLVSQEKRAFLVCLEKLGRLENLVKILLLLVIAK